MRLGTEKRFIVRLQSPFENGRFKLAPAYDVLPTHSGQGYQEFICGSQGRDSTLENALSECNAFGLLTEEATTEVRRVINVVETWKTHFAQLGVTQLDIDNLARTIDGDYLLKQRRAFNPVDFIESPKKRRTSPFQ